MICRVCKIDKDDLEFYLKKGRNCRNTRCKPCDAIALKEYRHQNKEKHDVWVKQYFIKNAEKFKEYKKANHEQRLANQRKNAPKWYADNKEKMRGVKKAFRIRHRERINAEARERLRTDLSFKLKNNLRCRIKQALKNRSKKSSAVENLGCSMDEFVSYIEAQFKEGMSWENWGQFGWHLDHKIPLSHFDLTDLEQFKKAAHYTNLQPLWWKDNLSKGAKVLEKYNER